jgi:methionyl-tRNA synthetase
MLIDEVGHLIETTHLKQALEEIFAFVRFANTYFDENEPWR